jgi:hypothetical protein
MKGFKLNGDLSSVGGLGSLPHLCEGFGFLFSHAGSARKKLRSFRFGVRLYCLGTYAFIQRGAKLRYKDT